MLDNNGSIYSKIKLHISNIIIYLFEAQTAMQNLTSTLFKSYVSYIRPVTNDNDTINLQIKSKL